MGQPQVSGATEPTAPSASTIPGLAGTEVLTACGIESSQLPKINLTPAVKSRPKGTWAVAPKTAWSVISAPL